MKAKSTNPTINLLQKLNAQTEKINIKAAKVREAHEILRAIKYEPTDEFYDAYFAACKNENILLRDLRVLILNYFKLMGFTGEWLRGLECWELVREYNKIFNRSLRIS